MKTKVKNILLNGTMACALGMLALGTGRAIAQTTEPAAAKADPHAVTAIDILLEPDATMIQHATVTNDHLRKVFPKGFALDATHHPHITLVQRFVLTVDKMLAEPFDNFTFSPAGAAVYHLGHFGTAAKKLKQFDLKS